MVPECKPEWNREAITVFSRLPSLRRLQATPLLQTSLATSVLQEPTEEFIRLEDKLRTCINNFGSIILPNNK